jgi:hypothetical protein
MIGIKMKPNIPVHYQKGETHFFSNFYFYFICTNIVLQEKIILPLLPPPPTQKFVFLYFLLAHLTQRVMWAIVTTERLSSVRPFVNFSHFNLLLWSHWANLTQTLVEWSLDGPLLVSSDPDFQSRWPSS